MAAPLIQFPRVEIQELVQDITELKVIWAGQPEPMLGQVNGRPGCWIELTVIATKTLGTDNDRLTYDPVNLVNDVTQVSNRVYTVQFKAKSFSRDVPAFDVIDQIRRGLRSVSSRDRLVETNIAFVDWGNTVDLPVAKDSRQTSESSMDVRIAWQVSADPGDNKGGWIQSVGSIPSGLTS